jgi:vitamin B12/bleomycin/antimicrobial peptide transport system ATP-binding/permease protein
MPRFMVTLRAFMALALPYFRSSEDRWRGRALLAGVIAAEFALVYVAVLTNQWNGRFFNALEARNWDKVQIELLVFLMIVVANTAAGAGMWWVGQHFQMRWRRWMTERFAGNWMVNGRHYRIRFIGPEIDNIHLRIANDIYIFIQKTYEVGSALVGVLVTLISFAIILAGLSAITPLPLFGHDFSFPGYLIVVAICYACIATTIAHFVGRRLIHLNFQQQRREADIRFATARVTDHSEQVALLKAEAVERTEINRRFGALITNWRMLAAVQTRLTGFTYGYAQVSMIFPTLVVTPAYLVGAIPLGVLMQAAAAFQKVETSCAYFINYYSRIAEWKAALDRLWQLEMALLRVETTAPAHGAIELLHEPRKDLALEGLVLRSEGGDRITGLPDLTLSAGDRLLISGASGSGKTTLFRALAGIWPFGEGLIRMPTGTRVLTLSARPYFPLGSLRQALAAPALTAEVSDAEIRGAMRAAGLMHLIDRLDEEADWTTTLSAGEHRRIGLTRALILRPDVLLIDDADVTSDIGRAKEFYDLLAELLSEAIVVSASSSSTLADFHYKSITIGLGERPPQQAPKRVLAIATPV